MVDAGLNELMAKEISQGVSRTLGDVFGIRPVGGDYRVVTPVPEKFIALPDVSGFVELDNQARHRGALMISFPETTIYTIMGKFYRREFTAMDKAIVDGVGEMTNMIFGVMKTNLGKAGFAFKMSLPKVALGGQTPQQFDPLANQNQTIVLSIPFETDAGPFTVTLILHPVPQAA